MSNDLAVWWPFGLFIYLMMFGMFLVPAEIVFIACYRKLKQPVQKWFGLIMAILLPLAGFSLYITIDAFESRGQVQLWWWSLLALHLVPALIAAYLLMRYRKEVKIGT